MINFRYHVVSFIAVFLALAIGVIMGSAVIDRAIVDRLEDQQDSLQADIDEVQAVNDELRAENRDLQQAAEQLAEEGSQRLLVGALADVPVLVLATRGVESQGFDDLLTLIQASGANQRGVLWLTDRFDLDEAGEHRDLADALEAPDTLTANGLRTLALTRLTTMLRRAGGPSGDEPPAGPSESAPPEAAVLAALRDARFVEFDPPEGQPGPDPVLAPGTRVVMASGSATSDALVALAVATAELLIEERSGIPEVPLLAAEELGTAPPEVERAFVPRLRDDDETVSRLSTVDNIGDFAGRLAAILAIVDLGEGRVGHYGRGPEAERLLPPPPEGEG